LWNIRSVIAVLHLLATLGILFRAVVSVCAIDNMRRDKAMEEARCNTDDDDTGNK
jgi:hypothetical protein